MRPLLQEVPVVRCVSPLTTLTRRKYIGLLCRPLSGRLSLGPVSVASAVSATRASAQATRGGGAAGQLGAPQLACARNHST